MGINSWFKGLRAMRQCLTIKGTVTVANRDGTWHITGLNCEARQKEI